MDALDVIYSFLEEDGALNDEVESLIKWFSEDEIVDWFVHGYFVNDDDDIIAALGQENAQIVLDHCKAHCE